jgi:hypothetical protein
LQLRGAVEISPRALVVLEPALTFYIYNMVNLYVPEIFRKTIKLELEAVQSEN